MTVQEKKNRTWPKNADRMEIITNGIEKHNRIYKAKSLFFEMNLLAKLIKKKNAKIII